MWKRYHENFRMDLPGGPFRPDDPASVATFWTAKAAMKIQRIETFCNQFVGFVRVTTDDGRQGWGQVAPYNVTINNILPGAFATDRLKYIATQAAATRGVPLEQIQTERLRTIPAGRLGDPAEFGKLCAFLASAHAGYITGQNLTIDGGAFPGAF